ncbi:hypothetical protein BDU57DRAFT_509485 [Ampelomyces quisqualis]|uniref:Uncharacterized protein n=1 Tax=Ampelomyces quisqualis TaxID=50730 RepID=A0A6A5QZX4_AMPQU|nr:hypothetical protein BDU57DRAFT_509485 [Ampelomyces quisqualis]
MRLTPSMSSLSLSAISLYVLAFSGLTFAAPISQNSKVLLPRADCEYGERLTLADYVAYLKKYYPATDHYLLYTAGSEAQATNFQGLNAGYYKYSDFYDASISDHFLEQWPEVDGCFRPEDAEAASVAIATVATSEVLVFGGVEYQTKGPNSFFTTKELPVLKDNINNGQLNKITHMVRDATRPEDVLATEDAAGTITFAAGHTNTETNASGTFGDCSTTLDPPTCDIPSG